MSKETFFNAVALLLLVSFIVPATFLITTPKAHAQALTGCLGGLAGVVAGGGAAAAATAVPVNSVVANALNGNTAASTWASCINQFVIEPLIRAAIRALIQKMTASVITWINGGNGTGQPSYVQNLPGHLQSVGDIQALSFFAQFGANSNSPFAAAITSSLSTNYLQNTSSAGFFAANQDTLVGVTGSAANEQAFLNGNWSQGGTAAWFALTTQSQNNPYMLYQASQSQLGSLVNGAQSNRLNELSWGSGFLSWCGPQTASGNGAVGTAPGDACRNADGTPGKIQTPGSVIHDYTQEAVVNSGFQQLISANDLDNALNAIIAALLNQVLGGAGGLFGASQNGAGNTSNAALTAQLQNYSTANATAATAATTAALQTAITQTTAYANAWQTIANAASAASTAASGLVGACTAAAATATSATFSGVVSAESTAAQNAITTEIAPVLAQANAAATTAATAQAMIQKVQNDISSGIDTTADLQALEAMPPSANDASTAVQNATATGGATANPTGSLTVAGGTTIDQMNLIATNATVLKNSVCTGP